MKKEIQKNKIIENTKVGAKRSIEIVKTTTRGAYKKSPKIFLGVLALLVAGAGYTYFKKSEIKKETLIVARGSLEEAVSVTGKIKASVDADLSFEKGGTVSAVYVKEGQKVYTGQTIAVLSGGTDYGQVLEARAGVSSALAQLDLVKNGNRREEIAVRAAGVNGAQTSLDNALLTIGDTVRGSYNNASDAIRYKTQNFFSGTVSQGYRTTASTCNSSLENDAANLRKQVEIDLSAWSKINTNAMSATQKEETLVQIEGYVARTSSLIELMSSIVNAPCVASDTSLENIRVAVSGARNSIVASQTEITAKKNIIASAKSGIAVSKSDLTLAEAGTEIEKVRVQEAAVRQAYARLYSAQAASSKNVVTAPGNGVITKVEIASGEYASPGKTIARLVGTGEFSVEADVTESDIARIVLKNIAKVIVPAIDAKEVFSGKVVSIDPAEQSSEGNPLYRIVVSLDTQDSRIKSGMTSETTIVTSVVENILRIPARFLTKIKGTSKVNVVIDSKSLETEEREIKTGRKSTDGLIEIVSGVDEGEIIVLPVAPKK